MTQTQTPAYIKALLAPSGGSRTSRRAWGIDVETVWVPFFNATNVMGETKLADDVLGAPIRLVKDKDGEVRFTQSGRPAMRVHKDLNDQVNIVRENFVAGLQAYTGSVMEERSDAYADQVSRAQAAGQPVMEAEQLDILAAEEKRRAESDESAGEAENAPDSDQAAGEAEHAPDSDQAEEKPTSGKARNNSTPKPDPEMAPTPAS